MLYALGSPTSFLLLVLSFVLAVTLHGWAQSLAAARAGDRQPGREQRLRPDPRCHIDPFGAIAAAIAGIGWARQVEPPDRRRRRVLVSVLLAGTAANLVLALACLVGFRLLGGVALGASSSVVLQRGAAGGSVLLSALYLLGLSNLFVAALSVVPLPPLPGGRILFGIGPRTAGWQKAEYRLVEQNIGAAVLLALVLIPLGGPQALLPTVLDTLLRPALRWLGG